MGRVVVQSRKGFFINWEILHRVCFHVSHRTFSSAYNDDMKRAINCNPCVGILN